MKAEIILTVMLSSLCLGERQQRSTVLTDESKRVLDHFDFSNFDKQEALNNIERQRYENQIRGKRSQRRYTKDDEDDDENVPEETKVANHQVRNDQDEVENTEKSKTNVKNEHHYKHKIRNCKKVTERGIRGKTRHHTKKKHKFKAIGLTDDEESNESETKPRRKKKRKKRRYWDNWTEWSPCSVTCGRGRKIRWRKCIAKNCHIGELEMGEKTCQLPACNLLTKLLGL